MEFAFFKKIKSKIISILNIKFRKKFKSRHETISYKSNAWKSKKSSYVYDKKVERFFFNKITWPLISENINHNAEYIIDLGAGTGRLTSKIIEMFNDLEKTPLIKAIDISKNMLDYLPPKPNLEKIVAEATNLPIKNNSANITLAMDFILHFPNWEDFLHEMVRVTSSEGKIIFNYVPQEHIKLTQDLTLLNPYPVAYTEYTANISEANLSKFCKNNNCTLQKIIPYNFFVCNELFRPLLSSSNYTKFINAYQKIYTDEKNKKLLEVYKDIEDLFIKNGDLKMCNLALAIIKVN